MTDFSGKNVLVIGGSRGIGADIVRRFTKDGGNVTFTYNGSKEAAEALARETHSQASKADSADRQAVVEIVERSGALDILVVNSGVFVGGNPLETDPDAVDRMIDVNVRVRTMPPSLPRGA